MLIYVQHYSGPTLAIAPHCLVVLLPLAFVALGRTGFANFINDPILSRLASSLMTASVLSLLIVYYLLVLIGLHSWGGIVSWNVIPTFFAQGPELLASLGVPPLLALGALALVYIGLVAACWRYLKHFDWTAILVHKVSRWPLAVCITCGLGIVAAQTYQFAAAPWTRLSEPVSLTFFPLEDARDLEGHSVSRIAASNLDHLEDLARSAYTPAAAAQHPNLILIVVDALRPDHMGVYGYSRDTTPTLSRLAQTSNVRRIIAHSSCGDTICGLLSLSSSKFPRRFSYRPFTLQEVLRRNGYRVHMILSGDHTYFYSLKGYYGQVDSFFDGTQARGYFMNDDQLVVDKLGEMPAWDGVPVMFQFHLMSAHILRKRDDRPGRFQPAAPYLFRDSKDTGPAGRVVESATNFYDNGVLKADSIVHQLLQVLERKQYLSNALVVITADHGESLGEHGLFQHANSVREELLRVPLLMISYGYNPERPTNVRPFVSQVDIAPTLLAEFDIPRPQTWSGSPIQELAGPDFTYFEEHAYCGVLDHRDQRNAWKYWIDTDSGIEHAFNLTADPHENRDAIGEVPAGRRAEWRVRASPGAYVALASR